MNKKTVYLIFIISMIIMPLLVLFTEKYFEYFLLALLYPSIIFLIIIYLYIRNQKKVLSYGAYLLILFINIINNIIISLLGGVLFAILGMAHYDSPDITTLTHVSFISWFIAMMLVVFIVLFFILIKPFVNHLDKLILKK